MRSKSHAFMSEDGIPQPIEFFIASDASAVIEHTKHMLYLEDDDIAHIADSELHIHRLHCNDSKTSPTTHCIETCQATPPHDLTTRPPPRLPLTVLMRPRINVPPGTIWTRSGLGLDQSRWSLAVTVPVPEFLCGTGLSRLRSGKNGLGPDQTELPQH